MTTKLKKTTVKTNGRGKSSKSNTPIVEVDGDIVTRYNAAAAEVEAATAVLTELHPEIIDLARPILFDRNIQNPTDITASIKLEDENEERLVYSFKNAYSAADEDAMIAGWDEANEANDEEADLNEYVQEAVSATFNSKVFLDVNGDFDPKMYKKFFDAIAKVAQKEGVDNPLVTKTVIKPKPIFHTERYIMFPSEKQQQILTLALPNTEALKPSK